MMSRAAPWQPHLHGERTSRGTATLSPATWQERIAANVELHGKAQKSGTLILP
jgi:hypothetical protein